MSNPRSLQGPPHPRRLVGRNRSAPCAVRAPSSPSSRAGTGSPPSQLWAQGKGELPASGAPPAPGSPTHVLLQAHHTSASGTPGGPGLGSHKPPRPHAQGVGVHTSLRADPERGEFGRGECGSRLAPVFSAAESEPRGHPTATAAPARRHRVLPVPRIQSKARLGK